MQLVAFISRIRSIIPAPLSMHMYVVVTSHIQCILLLTHVVSLLAKKEIDRLQ